MPPVFGPVVAVADPLVVLRRREAATAPRRPSHSAKTETSSPFEQLLDVERLAERLRAARSPASSSVLGAADPDALAGGEPVRP